MSRAKGFLYALECARCGWMGVCALEALPRAFCPRCGGLPLIRYRGARFEIRRGERGVWRYSSLLPPLPVKVSLGEGLTPVTAVGEVLVKNERLNPTGSYADRASAVIASHAKSVGASQLCVEYVQDFTKSLAHYLHFSGLRVRVAAEDVLVIDGEDAFLLASREVEVSAACPETLRYPNPLTVEGLKTIIFEMFEQGVKAERVVVPASTGVLALSLLKGLADLREVGLDASYEVVAAALKGSKPPYLEGVAGVRVVEVPGVELFETYRRLVGKGFRVKPIVALSYHVAENLGSSAAVATMGYRAPGRRKDSDVRRLVLEALRRGEALTAYEIWRENPLFTLRAVYKAVRAMESRGEICGEVVARGRRKVKVYRLCSY
ncbi:MAG: hypothetical protein QXI90_00780 [Thermofilum sp.]